MAVGGAGTVERWAHEARATYPDVQLETARFADHITARGIDLDAAAPHASDLFLACACASGDPGALRAFDQLHAPVIAAAAQRIDRSRELVDEVMQLARERLLVGTSEREPAIAQYTGQGPLRAWVRVSAMRIAMNLLRARRRDMLVDDEAFFDAGTADSGKDDARARYGQACSDALRAAFTQLTARERNLLRMHHLHGLSVDELAPTYNVHRATVARWIASARESLLEHTRAGLRERLAATDSTVDSILRGVSGSIDVTMSRLLAE